MFDKFNVYQNTSYRLSCKDVILGLVQERNNMSVVVNIILMYGKKFIYMCKLDKEWQSIETILNMLKVNYKLCVTLKAI